MAGNATREFERLLTEHLDRMYFVARRLTREPMDADDLVAEASLRAWKSFHTLRNASKPVRAEERR